MARGDIMNQATPQAIPQAPCSGDPWLGRYMGTWLNMSTWLTPIFPVRWYRHVFSSSAPGSVFI
jgi:hypothetical protein